MTAQSNMLKIISICILALAVSNTNSAFAAKLYKWVDNEGNISYQGSPPPEGSKVINEEEIGTSTYNTESGNAASQPTVPVIVYTVVDCESCELLLLRLQNWNVKAQEQSLQNREVQSRILEISDSLSAPTIFIGDKLISDMSNQSLISELQQVGYQIDSSSDSTPE